jgi:hypothetical protein
MICHCIVIPLNKRCKKTSYTCTVKVLVILNKVHIYSTCHNIFVLSSLINILFLVHLMNKTCVLSHVNCKSYILYTEYKKSILGFQRPPPAASDDLSQLRSTYRSQLQLIDSLKRQLAELDLGDDEEVRELEMERSLLAGEWNTEDQKLRKVTQMTNVPHVSYDTVTLCFTMLHCHTKKPENMFSVANCGIKYIRHTVTQL